jgi:hypothetical protein
MLSADCMADRSAAAILVLLVDGDCNTGASALATPAPPLAPASEFCFVSLLATALGGDDMVTPTPLVDTAEACEAAEGDSGLL